jgi:hypothetical protein
MAPALCITSERLFGGVERGACRGKPPLVAPVLYAGFDPEVINVLLRLAEEKVGERLPGYRPRVLEAARLLRRRMQSKGVSPHP